MTEDVFQLLLTAMMPKNRLALQVSLATGLRIGDVLGLKTTALQRGPRITVKEQKTGKSRRVYLPAKLYAAMLSEAGRYYVFEHRLDSKKPRTRAAVYKDLRRVASLYRIDGHKLAAHLSPHSARKIFAVDAFEKGGNLRKVQALLNHSDPAVTALYAMADVLTARAHRHKKGAGIDKSRPV